jgi:hypothetical protein
MLPSRLGSLSHDEREQVITVLAQRFPTAEAVTLLTALAGTRAEMEAVPMALQEQAQQALLATLPRGLGAIVVSALGIPTKSDQEALEDVLTTREKADPVFRQCVEAEALRRHIPRWLAASRLRWDGMKLDALVATLQHQADDASNDRNSASRR